MVLVLWCAFAIPAIVLWWCCLCFIGSRRVYGMVSDWGKGEDVQILFRVECVDEVALQATIISQWAARKVQAGSCGKVGRVVHRLFDIEWGKRQKKSEPAS